jgi:putative FmdB family regulatory protein
MPLYDYDCAACGRRVEVIHGVHAPGPTHCPNCGSGPMKKAITAAAVHFKGTGWAKRDRRVSVAPGPKTSGDSATASDGDGKADGSSKEPKSEPKSGTAGDHAAESGPPSGGESTANERHAVSSRKPTATTTTVSD